MAKASKPTVSTIADALIEKRLDILRKFLLDNPDIVKKWEQLKLEYETAKFKKKYIQQNEFFTEDPQLKLFGE